MHDDVFQKMSNAEDGDDEMHHAETAVSQGRNLRIRFDCA
jgi:hypothetical protein